MVKNRSEARRIGKLGKGKRKHFADEAAAIEQRRQAGIASGKARRERLARIARELSEVQDRLR